MQVRGDALLAPIFAEHIADDAWPAHLERMASFWYTVLFGEPRYHGNPMQAHAPLALEPRHFERWLKMWHETIDALFQGAVAEQAKAKAQRMAIVLQGKGGSGRPYVSARARADI